MIDSTYKIPSHVAIILDGNGRWATKRGLKRSMGHKEGFETLKKISEYIFSRGVKILSVFAFSTENFKRDKEEVDYLMNLFIKNFKRLIKKNNDVKIVFSGRKDNLSIDVLNAMKETEEKTKNSEGHIFNICLNYGGRADIIDATKKIVDDCQKGLLDINHLTEDVYIKYLYNQIPNIDLLIRTSGEVRISNFMLYQAAYAEMYFPEVLFPDFSEKDFDLALDVYNKRDRRFGGINNENKNN